MSGYRLTTFAYPTALEVVGVESAGFGKNGGRKGNVAEEVANADRSKAVSRAKRNIRRLILANALCIHMVLTFKENVDDVEDADKAFNKFWIRLRKEYPKYKNIKYVATRERQKRGAVHYHVVIDRFVPHKVMLEVWGHGFVTLVAHGNVLKASNYLSKYLGKELESEEWVSEKTGARKKAYLCSQNLDRAEDFRRSIVFQRREDYLAFLAQTKALGESKYKKVWDLDFSVQIGEESTGCTSALYVLGDDKTVILTNMEEVVKDV